MLDNYGLRACASVDKMVSWRVNVAQKVGGNKNRRDMDGKKTSACVTQQPAYCIPHICSVACSAKCGCCPYLSLCHRRAVPYFSAKPQSCRRTLQRLASKRGATASSSVNSCPKIWRTPPLTTVTWPQRNYSFVQACF